MRELEIASVATVNNAASTQISGYAIGALTAARPVPLPTAIVIRLD